MKRSDPSLLSQLKTNQDFFDYARILKRDIEKNGYKPSATLDKLQKAFYDACDKRFGSVGSNNTSPGEEKEIAALRADTNNYRRKSAQDALFTILLMNIQMVEEDKKKDPSKKNKGALKNGDIRLLEGLLKHLKEQPPHLSAKDVVRNYFRFIDSSIVKDIILKSNR